MKNSHKELLILLSLAGAQFVHIVDFMIIMPLGDMLMRVFMITPSEFSKLVAMYTFSAGLASFFSAFWIDRYDRKKVILFVLFGFIIGNFSCALAPTYFYLILARSLTGVFGGMFNTIVNSIVADIIPHERRGKAMGLVMAAFSVASVVGVPMGFYLSQKLSWHMPFYFLAILSIFILIPIFRFIPSMTTHLQSKGKHPNMIQVLKNAFGIQNQRLALLFMFILVLGQFSMISFLTPYMVRNVSFSNDHVNLMYFLGGAFSIFTTPFLGRLSDKIGKPKVFKICALSSLIPILFITNAPFLPPYVALFFIVLMFIFVGGRMGPAMAMVTASVAPINRGSFMGINSSFMQFGSSFAAIISGLIIREEHGKIINYEWVGFFSVSMSVIAIFLCNKIKQVTS